MSKRRKKHRSPAPLESAATSDLASAAPASRDGDGDRDGDRERGRTSGGDDDGAPAATPAGELSFSESMANWLAQGESEDELRAVGPHVEGRLTTRRRDVAVIGGALALALALVLVLRGHSGEIRPVTSGTPAPVSSRTSAAEKLMGDAEKALAKGDTGPALELTRQALALEPSFVDAYVTMAAAQAKRGQVPEARNTFRRYLELAPFGRRAAEARERLAALGD